MSKIVNHSDLRKLKSGQTLFVVFALGLTHPSAVCQNPESYVLAIRRSLLVGKPIGFDHKHNKTLVNGVEVKYWKNFFCKRLNNIRREGGDDGWLADFRSQGLAQFHTHAQAEKFIKEFYLGQHEDALGSLIDCLEWDGEVTEGEFDPLTDPDAPRDLYRASEAEEARDLDPRRTASDYDLDNPPKISLNDRIAAYGLGLGSDKPFDAVTAIDNMMAAHDSFVEPDGDGYDHDDPAMFSEPDFEPNDVDAQRAQAEFESGYEPGDLTDSVPGLQHGSSAMHVQAKDVRALRRTRIVVGD